MVARDGCGLRSSTRTICATKFWESVLRSIIAIAALAKETKTALTEPHRDPDAALSKGRKDVVELDKWYEVSKNSGEDMFEGFLKGTFETLLPKSSKYE